MKFNMQYRYFVVGAQFIGAPPIYRPVKGIDVPLADKSAVGAINRPLRDDRFRCLKFITGGGRDQSAP
jgi:hypothetical protein